MKDVLIILFVLCFVYTQGLSHGDLDQRIITVSHAIEDDPQNEELYFQRGKLYYQHEEYSKGIVDFNAAIEKGYQSEQANLYLSKSYYELKDYNQAETQIHIFFTKNPEHVLAHNLYGKILNKQNGFSKSAAEFQYVIDHSIKALPENYINAANSWVNQKSTAGFERAVSIIKKGLDKEGSLISLQQYLIKILVDAQEYDHAIEIQKTIISKKNRKESAYYALFEIANAKGDRDLAFYALKNAQSEWKQLPNRIKRNSAMITLKLDIEINIGNHAKTNVR
ncbi:MAG: tetratricopeptide (TPR) repeat protein [Saprospiraceae bacterium]|jgi:tetratricopeptide (TPR) repeat protein